MRYLPLTDADRRAMLARIGVADIDALFADIPKDKRLDRKSTRLNSSHIQKSRMPSSA